jgi:hypothetical protein
MRNPFRRTKTATYAVPDSPKMLRETLCVAQSGIAALMRDGQKSAGGSMQSHMDRLSRLIEECDRHRPLGRGGKHGNLHTPTCGCSR